MKVTAQLEKISKVYDDHRVLHDVDVTAFPGDFISLLGPSGCGKTTLLRLIAGFEKPSTGRMTVNESDIGYVFQEPQLLPWLNVRENFLLPFRIRKKSPDPERLRSLLALLKLESALNKFPHQLSGGMKMRVSLLRTLLPGPKLILMDEPFSALDEVIRIQLQHALFQYWLKERPTVFFVTHSISEAVLLSQKILLLGLAGQVEKIFPNTHELFVFPMSRTQTQIVDEIFRSFPSNSPVNSPLKIGADA